MFIYVAKRITLAFLWKSDVGKKESETVRLLQSPGQRRWWFTQWWEQD